MPDGIARKSQADDLIDRSTRCFGDIGPPGLDIRRYLSPELALRSDDDMRVVTGLSRGSFERPRDDQVAAFYRRGAGRDDGKSGHSGGPGGSIRASSVWLSVGVNGIGGADRD